MFFMYDGKIHNNLTAPPASGFRGGGGGGVYVAGSLAKFFMHGGSIEKNLVRMPSTTYSHTGGGGIYVGRLGFIIMMDGLIKDNTAFPSGGPRNGGGGIFIAPGGDLLINKGDIVENHARNKIDWQGGGGIYNAGKVSMHGGTIYKNDADWEGGGVIVDENAEFYMYGGKIIENFTNNDTMHGAGGVMIMGGSFITGNWTNEVKEKLISGNRTNNNAGGFSVLKKYDGVFNGTGVLTIMDGTVITGNKGNPSAHSNPDRSVGGAIVINAGATLNLYGGQIYGNKAGNNSGITWVDGTINLRGNPRVGGSDDTDAIYRHGNSPTKQVMNIDGPLGDNALISVREDVNDKGRPEYSEGDLTVIAQMGPGQGNATDREASLFRYMGTGNPRGSWIVMARDPGADKDLILGRPSKFALLHVPDTIHFGIRPLLTTNLVGPYGDAPEASNVLADYDEGVENWHYGFEIANTRHDNWSLTLQTVPFTNTNGIIGANPVAVSKDANNPKLENLNDDPLIVISRNNVQGEIIKWHWTQLDYKIEAQTALDTVVKGDFQSVFTWTLRNVPT
jgi:hypothetical protein